MSNNSVSSSGPLQTLSSSPITPCQTGLHILIIYNHVIVSLLKQIFPVQKECKLFTKINKFILVTFIESFMSIICCFSTLQSYASIYLSLLWIQKLFLGSWFCAGYLCLQKFILFTLYLLNAYDMPGTQLYQRYTGEQNRIFPFPSESLQKSEGSLCCNEHAVIFQGAIWITYLFLLFPGGITFFPFNVSIPLCIRATKFYFQIQMLLTCKNYTNLPILSPFSSFLFPDQSSLGKRTCPLPSKTTT